MTDTEMLDWLDKQSGTYTGKVIFRWSTTGRGWRLHETSRDDGYYSVRHAIESAMLKEAATLQDLRQLKDKG